MYVVVTFHVVGQEFRDLTVHLLIQSSGTIRLRSNIWTGDGSTHNTSMETRVFSGGRRKGGMGGRKGGREAGRMEGGRRGIEGRCVKGGRRGVKKEGIEGGREG